MKSEDFYRRCWQEYPIGVVISGALRTKIGERLALDMARGGQAPAPELHYLSASSIEFARWAQSLGARVDALPWGRAGLRERGAATRQAEHWADVERRRNEGGEP